MTDSNANMPSESIERLKLAISWSHRETLHDAFIQEVLKEQADIVESLRQRIAELEHTIQRMERADDLSNRNE